MARLSLWQVLRINCLQRYEALRRQGFEKQMFGLITKSQIELQMLIVIVSAHQCHLVCRSR